MITSGFNCFFSYKDCTPDSNSDLNKTLLSACRSDLLIMQKADQESPSNFIRTEEEVKLNIRSPFSTMPL